MTNSEDTDFLEIHDRNGREVVINISHIVSMQPHTKKGTIIYTTAIRGGKIHARESYEELRETLHVGVINVFGKAY